jgi:hypothetical protein
MAESPLSCGGMVEASCGAVNQSAHANFLDKEN